MAYRYEVRCKPRVPCVVNTNSARQVEFSYRKSSHTGVESTHRPSKSRRECPVDYKALLSVSEEITVTGHKLFPFCRCWSTVSTLMPIAPLEWCLAGVPMRGLY